MNGPWVLRAGFVAALTLLFLAFEPFGAGPLVAGAFGALLAAAAIFVEVRLRRASPRRLLGAAAGLLLALLAAWPAAHVLSAAIDSPAAPYAQLSVLLLAAYLGLSVGAGKGDILLAGKFAEPADEERNPLYAPKILDTSVIIDGRIADVAEAGFIEGTLVIPQFVLWELQNIADSADDSRRNRGRRGLDILQRIQNAPNIDVSITENDYPRLKEVDLKLIEMAKETGGKIVTHDFNLNKVARLHGVSILNLNELANSLKPVVLPGETMEVFILKEGKEYNQGVAYLDDGTMVVVDNARKHISKKIEISVTSVLQTTAGKMIFGRCDERGDAPRPAAGGGRRFRQANPPQPGAPVEDAPPPDVRRPAPYRPRYHGVEHAGR